MDETKQPSRLGPADPGSEIPLLEDSRLRLRAVRWRERGALRRAESDNSDGPEVDRCAA